jgi:hypothetical protein
VINELHKSPGISLIGLGGLFRHDETRTVREILRIGRQSIIVADHTKIGRCSIAFVAPITAVNKSPNRYSATKLSHY